MMDLLLVIVAQEVGLRMREEEERRVERDESSVDILM